MHLRSTLFCLSLAACVSPVHAADTLIPMDAFTEPLQFSQPRLSPDQRGGPSALVREDMQSGKRTVTAQDPLGSIEMVEFSAWSQIPFAVASSTGIPKARYLDPTAPDAVLHKALSGQFPDAYVHFINFTDDGQKLLFGVQSDRDPGSFYVFDKKTGKAALIFSNMPMIDPDLMAERCS